MLKPKLLVVEDDADTRMTMEALLADQFEVRESSSRDEALELIQAGFFPSCILMDYCMPGLSLDAFMQQTRIYNLEMLLLTAHPDGRQIAIKYGIRHLSKPVRPDELLAAIRNVAEKRAPAVL